uniref:Putative insulin/growth factor receptor n=1 Tax=Ixodes ricinus TaxID=34613 RepID=A0A6B0VEA9_IXORI
MRLGSCIFVVFWIEHVSSFDEKPYKCPDGTELHSSLICDGKGQCSDYYRYADQYDENFEFCVDPRNEYFKLHMKTENQENGTLDLSWWLERKPPSNSTDEKNRYLRDTDYVIRAGYFLTAKSQHHTVKKTLVYTRTHYRISCLKPWTNYEIILRPFYQKAGVPNTTFKVGEAAIKDVLTHPAAPSAPTAFYIVSVHKGNITMKIHNPDDWNGTPTGYRVRWQAQEDDSQQGHADFDFNEEDLSRYVETFVNLVAGRDYTLYVSARNRGYDKTFLGPEIEKQVITEPLDPVEVTAQSIGPKEIDVTWRTEGFADLFLVAVCNGSCPAATRRITPFLPAFYYSTENPESDDPESDDPESDDAESDDPNYVLVKVDGSSAESSVYSVLIETPLVATNLSVDVVSCYRKVCSEPVTTTHFHRMSQPPTLAVTVVRPTWIEVTLLPSTNSAYELRCCNTNSICQVVYTKVSATISNLIPNTTYNLELREALRDAKGHVTLGPAARKQITTWSLVPLSPVVKVAVPNAVGDTLVLSWTILNSTVDYLQISLDGSEWKNCTDGPSCSMSIIHGKTPFFVEGFIKISNLLLCTEYTISLRACNVDGCGNGTTVTAWTSMGGPSTPTDLKGKILDNDDFLVSWKRPGRPAGHLGGYMVSWKCPGAEEISAITTEKQLALKDLPNKGTNCKFLVKGFNLGPWDHQFVGDSAEFTFQLPKRSPWWGFEDHDEDSPPPRA